jgi:cellulose synthase/poly-beta-1,6-N-acetylglucosamine synthase-like glycosyltransferase
MLAIAVLCLVVLAYTYFGYPVLIGLLARHFPTLRVIQRGYEPTVTACIPAYNVEAYIDAKLQSLVEQEYPAHKLRIIVYSDASTDATDSIVRVWAARDPRISLVRGAHRSGKPTALNAMRRLAQGELLLLTDARQRLERCALRALVSAMSDPSVGCATGNLLLVGSAGSGAYWRYENWIRRQESKFRSVVGMTGPIAMVRRRDLGKLPKKLILDDVWIPMRLRTQGRKVVLVEEAIAYDTAFADDREFSRKVRTLAGNYQIFAWMPELLLPWKNPSWMETISHKLLRLACPWALLGLFLSCATIAVSETAPDPLLALIRLLLLVQLAFYTAALLGARAGRLATVARTFVVLNVAAQVGLWRFVLRRQAVTW